jgi:hypothetical protein
MVSSLQNDADNKLNEAQESEEEETVVPEVSVAASTTTPRTPSTKKTKTKKRRKKSAKQGTSSAATPDPSTPAPSDLDDVDRAIQEISLKYRDTSSPKSTSNPIPSHKYTLLQVSPKHLDADVELRKLFGKVVDTEARESKRQSIHGVPARVINRIKATQSTRKRTLMKPKDEWQLYSAYNKGMLAMDIVEKTDVIKFKFLHSKGYQVAQYQFYLVALQGDGNRLMEILREAPFHVDTWYLAVCPADVVFK